MRRLFEYLRRLWRWLWPRPDPCPYCGNPAPGRTRNCPECLDAADRRAW